MQQCVVRFGITSRYRRTRGLRRARFDWIIISASLGGAGEEGQQLVVLPAHQ